jgi:hypothetical protein
MAKPRLLFGIFLIAVVTTVGDLALTGYYGIRAYGQSLVAGSQTPVSAETFIRLISRQRLVAADEQTGAIRSKPNTATSPPKAKTLPKVKRTQETTVQWPWSLFSN